MSRDHRVNPLLINLEKVELTCHPFVSIHVALYNEKRVVERLIQSCTSQAWYTPGNKPGLEESSKPGLREGDQSKAAAYEVVIVDDSNDGTTDIAKQALLDNGWKQLSACLPARQVPGSRSSTLRGEPSGSDSNEFSDSQTGFESSLQTRFGDKPTENKPGLEEPCKPGLEDGTTDNLEIYTFSKPDGPTVKLLHRASRAGFKGGALQKALENTDGRAEYVCVFDADFVPYPDTIEQFVKTFQVLAPIEPFDYAQDKPIDADLTDSAKSVDLDNKPGLSELQTGFEEKRNIAAVQGYPNDSKPGLEGIYLPAGRQGKPGLSGSNIAAVQGYQWHVLNKSQTWVTRGVRSEYAGSYVIERSSEQIYGGLKQIAGSVYAIRADILRDFGWGTSITEDFELTLRLYEAGYKVVFTPYIQVPAEAVSTVKRLIRQRMRWAEGSSFNIKVMFVRMLFGKWEEKKNKPGLELLYKPGLEDLREEETSDGNKPGLGELPACSSSLNDLGVEDRQAGQTGPGGGAGKVWVPSRLTLAEKLEFLYFSFYYLQAAFFIVGTISWFIAEAVFHAKLPFWTAAFGWSLVLTNLLALPLMNIIGLFLEESDERDYVGILFFLVISYVVVPFQAYAAIKGFLEKEEGPWFRTPKTGIITDVFGRSSFSKFFGQIFGGRPAGVPIAVNSSTPVHPRGVSSISLRAHLGGDKGGEVSLGGIDFRRRLAWLRLTAPAGRINFRRQNRPAARVMVAVFVFIFLLINLLAFAGRRGGIMAMVGLGVESSSAGAESNSAEAILAQAPDPGIEQQINIMDQEYSTAQTTDYPTDNSLGIVCWNDNANSCDITTGQYTGETVYFEAVIKNAGGGTTFASLYSAGGTQVSGSEVSTTASTYSRVRSGAISLTNDTDYTARIRASSGTASILSARIIALQADPTSIVDTQTHIELGNNETTASTSMTVLSNPKYFQYDDDKYDGTRNAYFEASLKSGSTTSSSTPTAETPPTTQGTNSPAWTNPQNMEDNEGTNLATGDKADMVNQETFDFSSIPADATIVGVTARIDAKKTGTRNNSAILNLLNAGTCTAKETTAWTTSEATYTLGTASDTWSCTALTATNVKNAAFGASVLADKTTGADPASGSYLVDYVALTVNYTYPIVQTVTAELYNRTDGATVANSTITLASTSWTRVRSASAVTLDTTNDDEYEVGWKTAAGTASMANAKVVLTQNAAGGLNSMELYHNYVNTGRTVASDWGNFGYFNLYNSNNWFGGAAAGFTYYHEATLKPSGAGVTGNARLTPGALGNVSSTLDQSDVGTFSTTAQGQLPEKIRSNTTVTSTLGSSTYVYVLGGYNGNFYSTVYKATLNATTGDMGTFATASQGQLPATYVWHTTVTSAFGSSTYLYVLGGRGNDTYVSTVYKATLNATTGDMGTFTTSAQTQLPQTLENQTTVTSTFGSSTYVYVLGGYNALTLRSTVYKATLNATTGDMGTFATASQGQLPASRADHTTVTSPLIGSSTYVYVLGGSGPDSTVYKATLNATTGDIGTFSTVSQGQLPKTLGGQRTVTSQVGSSTYVYVLGGISVSSDPVSTVYKATLNADNGNMGTFDTGSQAQLPQILSRQTIVTSPLIGSLTYVYVLGGIGRTDHLSTVYKAVLLDNTFERQRSGSISPTSAAGGDIGTFDTTSQAQLPQVSNTQTTVNSTIGSSTYAYVLGGWNGSGRLSTVYKATLNADNGNMGTFDTTSQGQLPQILQQHTTITSTLGSSTYVHVLGGDDGSYRSTVYKATLNADNGNMGTFDTGSQAQLPQPNQEHIIVNSTIGSSTYVYALGGWNGGRLSTVYKATLNADNGNMGTFDTGSQAQLPQKLSSGTAVISTIGSSRYVYVLGGYGTDYLSTVYKATLNATSGDVGTFDTGSQGQLPQTLQDHNTVISTIGSSTYVYVLGGKNSANRSTVYKATLNATSGDVGTFSTVSQGQLPQAAPDSTTISSTIDSLTYLHVFGGGSSSTVYKAQIAIDGTEYDTEIQNATVANSTLVIDVQNLQIPENLLAFLPLGVFIPRLITKLREWRRRRLLCE
ncbi:hypothetical protein A3E71_04830 [Candidatus Curtissbacteria bacterium RIFCSPHIGHO2_12_FULL_42_33]|nr:MAG: hypothetical protein A3E71_04830 [Candidatus Curtissbacteria bacterium RIFCSPHIGHO2_12_FULL_42_33]